MIYDGECRFCRRQVERLAWFDRGERLAFVSLHDPYVGQRVPELSHEMMMDQMYVVDQKGQRYGGARAIRYLSTRIPLLWPLAPLMHIPWSLPFWQWAYKLFAVRRYLWNRTADERECEDNGACKHHFR